MTITSPAFLQDETIPERYTAAGPNINPPLFFGDIPEDAKSLVLIVQDLDAEPEPWTHWLLINIQPDTLQVAEGTVPAGATEGHANGGTPGYEGPNQPYFDGIHHYSFKLYALDTLLDLPETADRTQVEPAMQDHIIAEAELIGLQAGTQSVASKS